MVNGLTLNLFDFQEKAVLNLLDLSTDSNSKQTVVMKAPTGAGKTIILIGYVDEYFNKVNSNTAVIWLCPCNACPNISFPKTKPCPVRIS